MNKRINVAELLRKYVKDDEKLYCTMLGDVKLKLPIEYNSLSPIRVQGITTNLGEYGLRDYGNYTDSGECLLFPSEDQRDWGKWVEDREVENQEGTNEIVEISSTGEKIFAVGDKVYDVFYGWGEVVSYKYPNQTAYPVGVSFNNVEYEVCYTENGAGLENQAPKLSFTEYDLVNGGFSQKRPLPDIPMYTPIFVKGNDNDLRLRVFHHWSKENNPVCLLEDPHGISKEEMVEWGYGYFLELPEDFKKEIETYERVDD